MQTNNNPRVALSKILILAEYLQTRCGVPKFVANEISEIEQIAKAALAKPPRNCDVGTPEEQTQRFMAVCESVKPAQPHYSETGEVLCPSIGSGQECKLGICNFGQCALKWAQMPYEGAKGGGNYGQ